MCCLVCWSGDEEMMMKKGSGSCDRSNGSEGDDNGSGDDGDLSLRISCLYFS